MITVFRGRSFGLWVCGPRVCTFCLVSTALLASFLQPGSVQAQETGQNSEYLLARGAAAYGKEDYETAEQYLSLLARDPDVPSSVSSLAAFPRIRSELSREKWTAVAVNLSKLQIVDLAEPWKTELDTLEGQIAETLVKSLGGQVHGIRLDTSERLQCLVRPTPGCLREIAEEIDLPQSSGFAHHDSAAHYWSLAGDSGRAIRHLEQAAAAARDLPREDEFGQSRANLLASVAYEMALIGALPEARVVSEEADRERLRIKPAPTKGVVLVTIGPSAYEIATLRLASVEYLLGNGSRGDDLMKEVSWPSWREQAYAARVAWARKAGGNRDLAISLKKFRASLENDRFHGSLGRSENSKNETIFKFVLQLIEVGEPEVAKRQIAESNIGWEALSTEAEEDFSPDAEEVSKSADQAFLMASLFLGDVEKMISVFTRFENHEELERIAVFLVNKSLDQSLPAGLRLRCYAMLSLVLETLGKPDSAGEAAANTLSMLDDQASSFSPSKYIALVGVRHGRIQQLFWEALSRDNPMAAKTELFQLAQLIEDPWKLIWVPHN